jgi:hypothetical protein
MTGDTYTVIWTWQEKESYCHIYLGIPKETCETADRANYRGLLLKMETHSPKKVSKVMQHVHTKNTHPPNKAISDI